MIGVHGAGLSQIMFMRPHKSAVIEIFPFNVARAPYNKVAHQLGVYYVHWRNQKPENTFFDWTLKSLDRADRETTAEIIAKHNLTAAQTTTPHCSAYFEALDNGAVCSRILLKQDTRVDLNEFRVAFFRYTILLTRLA
jgi:hypothetical protein